MNFAQAKTITGYNQFFKCIIIAIAFFTCFFSIALVSHAEGGIVFTGVTLKPDTAAANGTYILSGNLKLLSGSTNGTSAPVGLTLVDLSTGGTQTSALGTYTVGAAAPFSVKGLTGTSYRFNHSINNQTVAAFTIISYTGPAAMALTPTYSDVKLEADSVNQGKYILSGKMNLAGGTGTFQFTSIETKGTGETAFASKAQTGSPSFGATAAFSVNNLTKTSYEWYPKVTYNNQVYTVGTPQTISVGGTNQGTNPPNQNQQNSQNNNQSNPTTQNTTQTTVAGGNGLFDEFKNGLVHCGRKVADPARGITTKPCTFDDLIILASRIIRFAMYLIVVAAAIVVIWIGWIYLSAGGNTEKVAKAKHAATSWVIGVVLVMCAWLIVSFVLRSFLSKEYLQKHPNALLLEKVDDASTQNKSLQDIITGQ